MALRDIAELPGRGRVTVDTAPIVYVLEDHPEMASRYAGFFDRAQASRYQLTISTITLAEVLTGPLRTGDETLARKYREALTRPPVWQVVDVTAAIAERAARIRSRSRLRLPDAIQMATALETSSIALVTRDRDFSGLDALGEGVPVYG